MYFDFLSLWELTLRSDLSDQDLKKLIPEKRGKLEDSIENFSLNSPSKSLVMLMGVPGSGKTTLAENLKKQFEGDGLSCTVISLDNLFFDYFMKNVDDIDFGVDFPRLHMICFQEVFNDFVDVSDVIILDSTFLSMTDRFVVLKPISNFFSNIVGIFLNTNLDTLRKVQDERVFKKISEEEFQEFQSKAEQILKEKKTLTVGFDTVYIMQR